MIDLLDSRGNYERRLMELLEATGDRNRTQGREKMHHLLAQWRFIVDQPEYRYKHMKLPDIDDAAFLTELHILRDERPAYGNIVKEIIQEATESLGAKLKKASRDIVRHAERELGRHLQEISSSFRERLLHARKMSTVELRDLFQKALDEESGHPTDLYAF